MTGLDGNRGASSRDGHCARDRTDTRHSEAPPLALVVAMDEQGVIGRDGDLPWHLPEDLKHFKQLTLDHPIIMGRRTWESIGRPLPRRRSIVISRQDGYQAPGAEVVGSLEQAVRLAVEHIDPGEELFVIGGAQLYAAALPLAQRLYLTRVHAEVEGDVRFPSVQLEQWQLCSEREHAADARHAFPFTIQVWQRQPNAQ